jgi:hypothetical protein
MGKKIGHRTDSYKLQLEKKYWITTLKVLGKYYLGKHVARCIRI